MHGLRRSVVAVALVVGVAACGTSESTPRPIASIVTAPPGSPPGSAEPSASATSTVPGSPSLTPVPGGVTPVPVPTATRIPVTQTDWGPILDRLPEGFPVHPDAEPIEPGEPASGAFLAATDPSTAARWYERALGRDGAFAVVDVGSALEDGTVVLNASTDIPEGLVRVTFRPAGESTMIIVLYGAACVGGPQ